MTMTLKKVGFFDEMPEEQRIAELTRLRASVANADAPKIIEYLEGGAILGFGVGVEADVLLPGRPTIGVTNTLTDGVWAWQSTLPYWVLTHNIQLPGEFLDHMRTLDWCCPLVEDLELENLMVEGTHAME